MKKGLREGANRLWTGALQAVPLNLSWLPRVKNTRFFLVAGLVVIIGAVLVGKFTVLSRISGPKYYYRKQLSQLNDAVSSIAPAASLSSGFAAKINANVDNYDRLMSRIIELCTPLATKDKQFAAQTADKRTQLAVQGSKRLCNDLIPVAAYSQNIYQRSAAYIKFPNQWPAVDSQAYLPRFNQISAIIKQTDTDMHTIDSSRTGDPGLGELTGQLDEAGKLTGQIKESLDHKDYVVAKQQSDTFIKKLADDKIHFLAARSYYWNNTIRISYLEKAIHKLQDKVD